MMLSPVIHQKLEWLNVQVGLARMQGDVTDGELYYFLSVRFTSRLNNLSMTATRRIFVELGYKPQTETLCNHLKYKLCRFHPMLRHVQFGGGMFTWESQRDQTRSVRDFDRNDYAIRKRLCFCSDVPVPHCARRIDGHGFKIQPCESVVDEEGRQNGAGLGCPCRSPRPYHAGGVRVGAIGWVQECRGEVSARATILIDDRGYGKSPFMDIIEEVCFSSISVMPEYLVSTHPFAGQFHMDTARDDILAGEVGVPASDDDEDAALASASLEDVGIGS